MTTGSPALEHAIEVGTSERRDEFYDAIRVELRRGGIPFFLGGRADERRPRLHLAHHDAERGFRAIVSASQHMRATSGLEFKPAQQRRRPIEELVSHDGKELDRFDIRVVERSFSSEADRYTTYGVIEVDVWSVDPNISKRGRWLRAPRLNDSCTSMLDADFRSLAVSAQIESLHDIDGVPNTFERTFPIDVVYTWVDDTDPEWQRARQVVQQPRQHRGVYAAGLREERFRNRDELRYSLRSLEMFAPFVRNVFLVTMDQMPTWLDTDHPQIRIMSHRDIYPSEAVLPTFNSSSIETQLHHIDGLSDHFVYFNDDVFLGQLCSWQDFFEANGVAKFRLGDHAASPGTIHDDMAEHLVADRNAANLLREKFGFTANRPMAHVPHATHRSTLDELEGLFPEAFAACRDEQFRSPLDIRPIAFMAHHFGFHRGSAMAGGLSQRYLALWKPHLAAQLDSVLQTRRVQAFCLNDAEVEATRTDEVDAQVSSFLDRYFPYPSRFEKDH